MQVVVVLLRTHTDQVVADSRYNGPCCSRSKSILAGREVHEEARQIQRIAKPPCDQQSAKSRTKMPGELIKFQTSQNVTDVVVVNSHCPQSNLDEQWLIQFVQVVSAKLLMKCVKLVDVSASHCEWMIVESIVVKVVRSPSESIVVSVSLNSCCCGRCKTENVCEVSRCSW